MPADESARRNSLASEPATHRISLRITREFDAPREFVWQAWTQHEHLMHWLCPKDFHVLFAELDLRVGGSWRSGIRAPDDSEYVAGGVYKQIDEPHRLVFTHRWEKNELEPVSDTVVTVTLEEHEGKTTMIFEQVGFATVETRDSHHAGWSEAFDNLAAHLAAEAESTADREITITRIVDAPHELVWQTFIDPTHISEWWEPNGFTTTTHHMDFRPGGVWRFTMHGPNGRDYPNHIVYNEIHEPHRLVYTHEDAEDVEPVCFQHTLTFDPHGQDGQQTRLTMRMVFSTAELRDEVARKYGAVEGGIQTLGRLAAHLAQSTGDAPRRMTLALPSQREIMLQRTFDAPRSLVFEAFTKSEHMRQWYGCHDSIMTVCEMDVRPGGAWRFVHRTSDGVEHASEGRYEQIVVPERIVQTFDCGSDDGDSAVETYAFEEKDGKTILTNTVVYPSQAVRDVQLRFGLEKGAGESMDRLEALLTSTGAHGR